MKPNGKILIADTKVNHDAIIPNIVSIPIAYLFGSSLRKNLNMDVLIEILKNDLKEFKYEEYFQSTFFIAYGEKPSL